MVENKEETLNVRFLKNYLNFHYISIFYLQIKVNDEVIQFRNDQPLEVVITASLEEKEVIEEPVESNKQKEKPNVTTKVGPLKPILKKQDSKNFESNEKKQEVIVKRAIRLDFEIHPLIRELEYLRRPRIILDAKGDRIYGDSTLGDSQRGGLPYYKPIGWQRFGLNVSLLKYENNDWLAKDGNPNEWAVGYHGLISDRYLKKTLLTESLVFSPNFRAGMGQKFHSIRNSNKIADNFGQNCGLGVYFSQKIESAQAFCKLFHIGDCKYKVVLQCRLRPSKINIPVSAADVYIVPSNDDIRPYGILIRKVVSSVK